MVFSFAHYCPHCRLPSDVYVDESNRPEGSPAFHYQCPGCHDAVTYSPFLFRSKTAIPAGAVVATRCPREASSAKTWDCVKSQVGTDTTVIPVGERKAPLSSLGVKNTHTFDTDADLNQTSPDSLEEVASLRGHRGWIKNVLFASDRGMVVSAGSDGGIKLWRFGHKGAPEQAIPHVHPGGIQALALTAEHSKLASAAAQPEGIVRLWDLEPKPKLRALLQVPKTSIESLAFSPGGNLLAIGCDKSVLLWNVTKPDLREHGVLTGHSQAVKALAFSSDGSTLASGGLDGTVRFWSTKLPGAREMAVTEGSQTGILSVAFSPDGQLVAWEDQDHAVCVKEERPGQPRREISLRGHMGSVRLILFPTEGSTLLTVDDKNSAFLWDLTSATRIHQWRLPGGATVASVGCSSDGRYMAAGSMGIITIYRLYPKNSYSSRTGIK